jgi:hypothetical protein
VVQSVCCWACRECNNQSSTGAAKVMDGRDKRVTIAAGEGPQQGTAAGNKSVNNWQREWRVAKRAMAARAMAMAKRDKEGNGDGD